MNKLRFTFAILLAIVSIVSVPLTASAASNSIGVNPRRDYTVKSGDTVKDTIVVNNLNKNEALTVDVQLIDFSGKDESGSPELLLKRTEPTRWSLKPYLTIAKDVSIPAGKSVEVPFSIAIPKELGAGSYYSAIKYSSTGEAGSNNVNLTSSAASLIFVRVPGEAKDELILEKFGAFNPDASGPSGTFSTFFGSTTPKYLAYRLTNKGNVAEQPVGSIELKNMFGKQVKLFEDANPAKNIVLIDQTRRFDVCLNGEKTTRNDPETGRKIEENKCNTMSLSPGRYTANLALIYGDNGSSQRQLGAVVSFWYLPLWSVIVFVVALALVAAAIWFTVRKISNSGKGYRTRR